MKLLQGWPVRRLETVDSTNEEAKRWLAEGAPDGALVIADAQSAGRGRLGRKWHSPPGANLYLSQAFRAPAESLRWLPLIGALAARAAIARTLFPPLLPRIKWPNDIDVLGLKTAGILCEAAGEDGAVLGIGININVCARQFPTGLRRPAASLRMLGGKKYDREQVLTKLVLALACFRRRWRSNPQSLTILFARHCSTIGKTVTVEMPGERLLTGKAVGLDQNGALILELPQGGREIVLAGEVVRLS